MACKIKETQSRLNIVLVGKTGNGKSATGNSILNRSVFKTSSYSTSCTEVCELESARHEDHVINVIDTPGLMDTSKSPEEIFREIEDAMSLCQGGFNAFILVLRWDIKYTDEEFQTYNIIKSFFGPDFLKVCIIAFTRGDIFEDNDEAQPFDEWIQEQKGVLKEILKECNSRVVLFYNSNRPEYKKKGQAAVSQLIKLIDDNDMLYTDENFQKAEDSRKKITIESKLPQLQAKYQEQLSLLQAEYEKASTNMNDDSIESLLAQAQRTLDTIIEDADGTEVLDYFKEFVTKEIQHINELKHSKNRKLKLQKLSKYNNLLKHPPSKMQIALAAASSVVFLAAGAASVGASIASLALLKQPGLSITLVKAAAFCGKKSLDYYANTYDLVSELSAYNTELNELDKEIQELNEI